MDVMDSTVSMTTDACSGVRMGVTQAKVTLNRPSQNIGENYY